MARNRIEDLRDHCFDTIERLLDEDDPMDIERARAVADVAKVVVDSAKAEVAFMKVSGLECPTTSFMTGAPPRPRLVVGEQAE